MLLWHHFQVLLEEIVVEACCLAAAVLLHLWKEWAAVRLQHSQGSSIALLSGAAFKWHQGHLPHMLHLCYTSAWTWLAFVTWQIISEFVFDSKQNTYDPILLRRSARRSRRLSRVYPIKCSFRPDELAKGISWCKWRCVICTHLGPLFSAFAQKQKEERDQGLPWTILTVVARLKIIIHIWFFNCRFVVMSLNSWWRITEKGVNMPIAAMPPMTTFLRGWSTFSPGLVKWTSLQHFWYNKDIWNDLSWSTVFCYLS